VEIRLRDAKSVVPAADSHRFSPRMEVLKQLHLGVKQAAEN
jgi:hypothetical protein